MILKQRFLYNVFVTVCYLTKKEDKITVKILNGKNKQTKEKNPSV